MSLFWHLYLVMYDRFLIPELWEFVAMELRGSSTWYRGVLWTALIMDSILFDISPNCRNTVPLSRTGDSVIRKYEWGFDGHGSPAQQRTGHRPTPQPRSAVEGSFDDGRFLPPCPADLAELHKRASLPKVS